MHHVCAASFLYPVPEPVIVGMEIMQGASDIGVAHEGLGLKVGRLVMHKLSTAGVNFRVVGQF
jgi:hypothetical protein